MKIKFNRHSSLEGQTVVLLKQYSGDQTKGLTLQDLLIDMKTKAKAETAFTSETIEDNTLSMVMQA
jgi:hypothetical protein